MYWNILGHLRIFMVVSGWCLGALQGGTLGRFGVCCFWGHLGVMFQNDILGHFGAFGWGWVDAF